MTSSPEIQQFLHDANEELKRVDHQVYVSLKYTRTVDVLMNILGRMIEGYDRMFDALLHHAMDQRRIGEIPTAPLIVGNTIKELYPDEIIQQNVDLYFLLRKLQRSNPTREQEFRRHVTMRTIIEGREELVNIDIATEYYHMQREFISYLYKYFNLTKPETHE
jgi:hypothetical protein